MKSRVPVFGCWSWTTVPINRQLRYRLGRERHHRLGGSMRRGLFAVVVMTGALLVLARAVVPSGLPLYRRFHPEDPRP